MGTFLRKVFDFVGYLVTLSTALVSLVFGILDLAGLLDSSPLISKRIPTLTLLACGFIGLYLIWERATRIDRIADTMSTAHAEALKAIDRSTKDTIRSLNGVEVRCFETASALLDYAAVQMQSAKRIEDVTWARPDQPRPEQDRRAYQSFEEAFWAAARDPEAVVRRVVSFRSPSHFAEEKRRMLADDTVAYYLGYYDASPAQAPPNWGFMVVDGQEVLVSSSRQSIWLSIRQPDLIAYYSGNFDELWDGARKLKQGRQVDAQGINDLEKKLSLTPT